MHILSEATHKHVQEAIQLFSVSTMNAAKDGGTQGLFGSLHERTEEVEQSINRTLRLQAQRYPTRDPSYGAEGITSTYKFVSRVK
ncbi:unnamed protein product [Peronospora destructor]|uniref:Uncharacterized protein n=1 Tax=Peronospora destructor TaxID=86335 RepID=A0AAV0TCI9_9STRA|nr:unnamed protein product [Peronospora destructor]